MVTIYTSRFNSTFCIDGICMILSVNSNISLNSVNKLMFVMITGCVSAVHSVNTRNKHQLKRPIANLSCFQKSAFCTGIKIFNSLPSSLTSGVNKKSQFKVALKRYLNTHSFYTVDEFLMF
jgi:hypothetical protein